MRVLAPQPALPQGLVRDFQHGEFAGEIQIRRILFLCRALNGSISLSTSADRFAQSTILEYSSLQNVSVASRFEESIVSCFNPENEEPGGD